MSVNRTARPRESGGHTSDAHTLGTPQLAAYTRSAAEGIVAWASQSSFSRSWLPDGATPAVEVLDAWHADPDVRPQLLLAGGQFVAYGELWVDDEEGEVELAHLVVDPEQRGRGLGRALATSSHGQQRPWDTTPFYASIH